MFVNKKLTLLPILVIISLITTSTLYYYKSTRNNYSKKNIISITKHDTSAEHIPYRVKLSKPKQWSLLNTGQHYITPRISNDWEADKRVAHKGMDINFRNKPRILRPTIIAILDSDINRSRIKKENLWINTDESPNDGIDNDKNGFVDDYYGWDFVNNCPLPFSQSIQYTHGTSITKILASNNHNFSPLLSTNKIKLMPLQILHNSDEEGHIDDLIEAIVYAEKNGAQICNMSLCTYKYSKKLESTIKKSKMLFIVPVGNDGIKLNASNSIYPACFNLKNVISVSNLRFDGKLSKLSNYGTICDIAAPGTDILVPINSLSKEFFCLNGTSCAVPFVSALAAYVLSSSKTYLSNNEIKKIICYNGTFNKNLTGKVKHSKMINYDSTLEAVH